MKVRNVVKVMNFHSLLRVDSAKRSANKYQYMEEALSSMIDGIINNRNLLLDKKLLLTDETAPVLSIYLGSDFGFCSNFNSRINEEIRRDAGAGGIRQILIGRKLYSAHPEAVLFRQDNEEFRRDMSIVQKEMLSGIRKRKYSRIMIVYNHYENTSSIRLLKKQVFPIELPAGGRHNEDFVVEGDLSHMLKNLIMSYVNYEIVLADVFSKAAENLMRQNATNESLKRIDEMEEARGKAALREKRDKEFVKLLEDFTKLRSAEEMI